MCDGGGGGWEEGAVGWTMDSCRPFAALLHADVGGGARPCLLPISQRQRIFILFFFIFFLYYISR